MSEAELASLQQNADKINAEIQALEKKILDIGGSKLLAQKSKVDGIKVYINIATEEITKCEVNIATAEKDLKRLGDAIATKSSELAKVDEEVAKLEKELKVCEDYVASLQDEVAKAQQAEESEGENLDALKQELDEQTEKIQKFRKKEVRTISRILYDSSLTSDERFRWRLHRDLRTSRRKRQITRRRLSDTVIATTS